MGKIHSNRNVTGSAAEGIVTAAYGLDRKEAFLIVSHLLKGSCRSSPNLQCRHQQGVNAQLERAPRGWDDQGTLIPGFTVGARFGRVRGEQFRGAPPAKGVVLDQRRAKNCRIAGSGASGAST